MIFNKIIVMFVVMWVIWKFSFLMLVLVYKKRGTNEQTYLKSPPSKQAPIR